jgi:hypothetical protein
MRGLACLLAELAAGLGEFDDAASAVFRLGDAPDRAQRFKLVEHVDHDAGRHADPAGELERDSLLPGSASSAARTLTFYESVRTVVLIGAAIWLLLRRRRRPLRLVLILNAITQSGDAVIGLAVRHSAPGALGPACFAAALAYAAWRLSRVASLTL